ncbi:uncharacterized protein LOC114296988 [Camellia sinensis]|uniref:uncharacterized protein LOC114296988 n=1 Tax=Camellia sinensis TaxID=4442 RepID=UPI0010356320|nr:uncharacterized protein LOC114296988 [Camellia sinensis]
MTRKELAKKTQEAAKLFFSLNHAEANNRTLFDQAKASRAAQNQAKKKAKTAEANAEATKANLEDAKAKAIELEAKLQEALDSKDAEVKAADEKAFEEGQAAVCDQYKGQDNLAYNQGYYLDWTAVLNKISVPMASLHRDINQLQVPFPLALKESDDDVEKDNAEEEAEDEKGAAVEAKSPTLNEQVLDLIQDEEDEVSKSASPKRTASEAEVQTAEKSLDQTILEIDAEIEANKTVVKLSQLFAEADTQPIADAEQSI